MKATSPYRRRGHTLPDEFTASPAISSGRIYLRGFRALYAISEGGK